MQQIRNWQSLSKPKSIKIYTNSSKIATSNSNVSNKLTRTPSQIQSSKFESLPQSLI